MLMKILPVFIYLTFYKFHLFLKAIFAKYRILD